MRMGRGALDSPRFVLVRGLAREAAHWHDFDGALKARVPGATIERVDLPGNGARWREPSPLTARAMAGDLRRAVWARGRAPAVLVTISLGGMVGLEWLRAWPGDPVVGLTAINTSVGGLSRPWERLTPSALVAVVGSAGERDPVARERAISRLTTSVREGEDERARLHAEIHRLRPTQRVNALRQVVAAVRFRGRPEALAALTTPVLVLSGAGDRMVAPRCSRALAQALGHRGELAVHPSGGHDLSLDDPAWCVEQIHRWLGVLSSPGGA